MSERSEVFHRMPPARVAVDAEDSIRTKVLYTEKVKADKITLYMSDVKRFLEDLDEERRQSNEAYREWQRRSKGIKAALSFLLDGQLWDAVDTLRYLLGLEDVGEEYERPVRHFYDGYAYSTFRPEPSEAYKKHQSDRCKAWRRKRKEASRESK
jgi:hypothetical protein